MYGPAVRRKRLFGDDEVSLAAMYPARLWRELRLSTRRGLRRTKFGFWTTVFQRMQISSGYFRRSYISELLELTDAQMFRVIEDSDQSFQLRLLHTDLWGRVCIRHEPDDANVSRLREFVRIRPE